jgi:hypothetical protein
VKLVVVESPYAGKTPEEIELNKRYARACLRDCLLRDEAPYCSHLLYTQEGILRDEVPAERDHGIRAGFAWGDMAHRRAVYTDRGISSGMKLGIARSEEIGQHVEYRTIPGWTNA